MSAADASSDGLPAVEIPPPPLAARMQIARFLVELLSKRALAELGILPGDGTGTPR